VIGSSPAVMGAEPLAPSAPRTYQVRTYGCQMNG
jgi:hypothetical protein